MPGGPHSGSEIWEAPDRETGKPGENRGKVIAYPDLQPTTAFHDRENRRNLRSRLWAADVRPVDRTDQLPDRRYAEVAHDPGAISRRPAHGSFAVLAMNHRMHIACDRDHKQQNAGVHQVRTASSLLQVASGRSHPMTFRRYRTSFARDSAAGANVEGVPCASGSQKRNRPE